MTSNDSSPGGRSLEKSDQTNEITPQEHATDQDGDLIAQFTLDYLDVLNGGHDDLPSLDDLSPSLRGRVLHAWSSIDRLISDEPLLPLDADPAAIALGAVPARLLDPAAMRRARQARNLRPSDIAASLRHRGWQISTADVFAWERQPQRVAPALLTDIAATVDVRDAILTSQPSTAQAEAEQGGAGEAMTTFLQVLYSDDLNEVVEQWAHLLGLDPGAAREDLQRRLSGAAYRGARVLTTRQWKAVLVVLLASERARRGQPSSPDAGQ
jgi:hypothetical protein